MGSIGSFLNQIGRKRNGVLGLIVWFLLLPNCARRDADVGKHAGYDSSESEGGELPTSSDSDTVHVVEREPSVVGLFSISKVRSDSNPILVKDDKKTAYYRAIDPGLSLAQCLSDKMMVTQDYDGKYEVLLMVKPEEQRKFDFWTREHIGESIGFVCGSRVLGPDTLKTHIRSLILIGSFTRVEDAQALCDSLRNWSKKSSH